MKRILTHMGALCLGLLATPLLADSHLQPWAQPGVAKAPYIFTQQHNIETFPAAKGNVQLIRLGYPLQVQLPGSPALWSFDADASRHVEYRGRTMVYSPDRVAGTESLLIFDLALSPDVADGSEGHFTFTTDELPDSLDNVVPGGIFVVHFKVVDPT